MLPGDTPFEVIPGTNERMPDLSIPSAGALSFFTHDQFRAASHAYGERWYETINAAIVEAREKGDEPEEARIRAIVWMMEDFVKDGEKVPQAGSSSTS